MEIKHILDHTLLTPKSTDSPLLREVRHFAAAGDPNTITHIIRGTPLQGDPQVDRLYEQSFIVNGNLPGSHEGIIFRQPLPRRNISFRRFGLKPDSLFAEYLDSIKTI